MVGFHRDLGGDEDPLWGFVDMARGCFSVRAFADLGPQEGRGSWLQGSGGSGI